MHIIFQGAVKAVCIDHHEAFRAALSFLTQFIELGCPGSAPRLKPWKALAPHLHPATLPRPGFRDDVDDKACRPVVAGVLEVSVAAPSAVRVRICRMMSSSFSWRT